MHIPDSAESTFSTPNAVKQPPAPLIDQADRIGNPLSYARLVIQQQADLPDELREQCYEDLLHTLSFLSSYNGSTATYNSYRRESERLLQWCWRVAGVGLRQLKRQHLEDYLAFCQQPPASWTGSKNVARFKNTKAKTADGKQAIDATGQQRMINPDWRPFVSSADDGDLSGFALSQKSLQSVFSILSTYFNYLQQEDYLEINPVRLIRQRSKYLQRHAYQEPIRRISNLQWDFILNTVEQMAAENPIEHERSLFVMRALFAMYLRISELVADERSTPTMGDFQQDRDRNWWLRVVGKGNKVRMVTVSEDMLAALKRYREHLGLSPLPQTGELTPLISKLRGRGAVTSTRQIRYLVQHCFDQAYQAMQDEGLSEEARELKAATVHWLRHTGISEDVKFRPKEHVKEDAGHASMATTDRYIDTEMRERHASGRYKKLTPEDD